MNDRKTEGLAGQLTTHLELGQGSAEVGHPEVPCLHLR